MTKIAIVGDPHIMERNPRCRTDNYLDTVLKKLEYIAENNDKVIILGDLFEINCNSTFLFNKVYKVFAQYLNKFIAIPGNHDLYHHNLSTLDKTTLGSLYYTGVLDLKIEGFKINNTEFEVSLVDKNMEDIPIDKNNEKILLGHNYYQMPLAPQESFTEEDIEKLNYRMVFLGHDHKPYEDEFIGNSILIRMGSLTRKDTQDYNEKREIHYYQFDTETDAYEVKTVPSRPSEEVYQLSSFKKDHMNTQKSDISFLKVGEVLDAFRKRSNGNISLDKTLQILGANMKQRKHIRMIHEMCNEVYN